MEVGALYKFLYCISSLDPIFLHDIFMFLKYIVSSVLVHVSFYSLKYILLAVITCLAQELGVQSMLLNCFSVMIENKQYMC